MKPILSRRGMLQMALAPAVVAAQGSRRRHSSHRVERLPRNADGGRPLSSSSETRPWFRDSRISSEKVPVPRYATIPASLPGRPGATDPRRPYAAILPGVSAITWLDSAGNSFFSSMQASVEKRLSKGFLPAGELDLGARPGQCWGDRRVNGPVPQDPTKRRADWASSNSDLRHRVNIAGTYQLPCGSGHGFVPGNSFVDGVIRNWEVGGIVVMQSGLPYTVTVSGSPSNTGSGSRANPVPNPSPAGYRPVVQSGGVHHTSCIHLGHARPQFSASTGYLQP